MMTTHRLLTPRLLSLLVACLVLLPFTHGQAAINIEITQGAEGALPIAVIPFVNESGNAPPPENMAGIITNDLRRSGKFEPLPDQDLISRPSRLEEVKFETWRALGVDNLVVGGISHAGGDQYDVRFELLDVYKGSRIEGKRYRVKGSSLRTLAHNISDLIYEVLTGEPGAFNTQIVYVSEIGKAKDRSHQLILADADAARPQVILTSPASLM
jgi:TolB protein